MKNIEITDSRMTIQMELVDQPVGNLNKYQKYSLQASTA